MDRQFGAERSAVQNTFLKYISEPQLYEYTDDFGNIIRGRLKWEYLDPQEAQLARGGKSGLFLRDVFIKKLCKLNPNFVDEEKAEEIIKRMERVAPNIEGNFEIWEFLKGLKTVFDDVEKRERNVTLIDTENFDNNTFHVTDEFSFSNVNETIRADIVCFINGIPILLVETKAAHLIDGMVEALDQVRRYHRETPEFFSMLQLYTITHILSFYYSSVWNFSRKWLFNWKTEVEDKGTPSHYEALVKTFMDRERIIKVISDFTLFTRQDDELKKVVLRPHQMYAVENIKGRVLDKEKSRGLVWHTQGSGKTYTMIVVADKLIRNKRLENPTIIMLVDRNELESQLFGNLDALGFEHVEVAESKKHLQKLLKNDHRGLIVSTIHKFDKIQQDINTRENIAVLIDEAHRSTGGDLGDYLMGALPNATFIGFTGTPIDKTKHGKGTFVNFGRDDPPNGYLDKYSISDSIKDGTTLKLNYTLAPNALLLDKETLEEEFFALVDLEGISDVESLNKVLERAVNLRNMLKNEERVERIGEFVANHFKEHIEPMDYKAFLVAVDREACALYKKELDKHLPPEYSEVVYSPGYNDSEELKRHHLSDEKEKQIRKGFRNPKGLPKILIVTEKLLTGFDAPILYCMYLDKPMRDHVLLQAIARVNRPYEDEEGRKKPSGFVLDFVGIFDNLEKALAFDSKDIEGVVEDIEKLKIRFQELMDEGEKEYLSIIRKKNEDKAVEAIIEHFRGEDEGRQKYYKFFKEVADIYEIISPDAFLREYMDSYEILARIYRMLKEEFDSGVTTDRELMKKTAKLVQKHTKSGMIRGTIDYYELDYDTLSKIEESGKSDAEKVFNLRKSIEKAVKDEGARNPVLIEIGERAERIIELYKTRQATTKETLEALSQNIEEILEARKGFKEKNMTPEGYLAYTVMKSREIPKPEEKARKMERVFGDYPHWRRSENQSREVNQEFFRIVLEDIDNIDDKIIKEVDIVVTRIINILKKKGD